MYRRLATVARPIYCKKSFDMIRISEMDPRRLGYFLAVAEPRVDTIIGWPPGV